MNPVMKRMYEAAHALKGISGASALGKLLGESPQTVKNWEARGASKSGLIKAQQEIGCFVTWLETGNGQMCDKSLDFISKPQKSVPLISWQEAKNCREVLDNLIPGGENDILVTCPVNRYTYALRINDDSNMPKFEIGAWIVVEPDEEPVNQKWCVVDEGGEEVRLKQLIIDGKTHYLRSDNPRFPMKEKSSYTRYCGTVKQLIVNI